MCDTEGEGRRGSTASLRGVTTVGETWAGGGADPKRGGGGC